GSLLECLQSNSRNGARYTLLMPGTDGPCRFGVYNLLNHITLEQLGLQQRVRIWSPKDGDYFEGASGSLKMLIFSGCMAADLLHEAMLDARAAETERGAAQEAYGLYGGELLDLLRNAAQSNPSTRKSLWEVTHGGLFGISDLLAEAARRFGALRRPTPLPTVLVVGEIYVRCDPFSNDGIIDKLEQRGLRVRRAPVYEWLEYCDYIGTRLQSPARFSVALSSRLQRRIQSVTRRVVGEALGWPAGHTVDKALAAARPYLRDDVRGEAVLTIGHPVHEWRSGLIDGVVSVGPLECMPNKIAEAQFYHVAEREGLPSLTLSYSGEPLPTQSLDNFAFEVRARFHRRMDRTNRGGRPQTAG
ncbi:MAG: CoA activase, partial [Acidobacteriota bacterium]